MNRLKNRRVPLNNKLIRIFNPKNPTTRMIIDLTTMLIEVAEVNIMIDM